MDEWRGRSSRVLSLCEDIAQLHCSVVGGANRAVLYDLYPYVWDLRNTALVAKAFICWLGEHKRISELREYGTIKSGYYRHTISMLFNIVLCCACTIAMLSEMLYGMLFTIFCSIDSIV